MKFPPPLRFAVPAIMMLFGVICGAVYYYFETGRGERAVEESMIARARHLGGKLASMCPYLIENNLPDAAQRDVSLSMTQRNLRFAHVLDGDDRILFSTRQDLRDLPAVKSPMREYLPLVGRARGDARLQVEPAHGGSVLVGAFPFELNADAAGSFTPGTGVVFLEYDLATPKAFARGMELRHLSVWGSVLVVLCIALTFLFHTLLTTRVRRLADATEKFANGQFDVRSGIGGSDEIAGLSEGFDRMAEQFQAHDTELRENEARFRFLVESIPQVFWLTQASPERVLYVSPAFEKIWGRTAEELYRNPRLWVDAIHAEDRERVTEAFEKWVTGHAPEYEVTYRLVRPDGDVRWIRDRGTYVDAARPDQPRRIAGFAEDITREKRAAEGLEAMERKLQDTQRLESLGVLAGGIAHDFNNLLTGMLGNASLARMMIPQSDGAQQCLGEIETSAQRAAELCKQMLAYSGKGRFVVQLLDLNSLVEECTQLLRLSIDKSAELRFDLASGLPPVLADPTQLRQVVMNLVINASEALGTKGGIIAISSGVEKVDAAYLARASFPYELAPGDYVRIEVRDNGSGIEPGMLARIFDPFFTTKFAGRGLGLSAVLGIVRGHKGALKVESKVGSGTVFTLLFPIAKGRADASATNDRKARGWRGSGTVLLVDDEETVRVVASRMLETFGFTPLLATGGAEAVKLFEESRESITAVILDLTMPHMDGEETFRRLREIDPAVRVILMSGFNEHEALDRFSTKGLSGFLQKPFTPDDLVAVLQALAPNPDRSPA